MDITNPNPIVNRNGKTTTLFGQAKKKDEVKKSGD